MDSVTGFTDVQAEMNNAIAVGTNAFFIVWFKIVAIVRSSIEYNVLNLM